MGWDERKNSDAERLTEIFDQLARHKTAQEIHKELGRKPYSAGKSEPTRRVLAVLNDLETVTNLTRIHPGDEAYVEGKRLVATVMGRTEELTVNIHVATGEKGIGLFEKWTSERLKIDLDQVDNWFLKNSYVIVDGSQNPEIIKEDFFRTIKSY